MKVKTYYYFRDEKLYTDVGQEFPLFIEWDDEDYLLEPIIILKEGLDEYGTEFINRDFCDSCYEVEVRGVTRYWYAHRFLPKSIYERLMNEHKGIVMVPVKKQAPKRKPRIKKDKPSNLRRLLNAAPNLGGICSYALEFLHADGTRRQEIDPNSACHASINTYPYTNDGKENGAVLSQLALRLSHCLDTNMDYKPWLKWYLKDSPFSRFIKPTTVHNAIKHGILIDCDKANAEVAAWVACTSRWLFEHKKRIPLFNAFIKIKGVTPNAAFVAANTLLLHEKGYSLWCNLAAHDSFDSRVSLDNLSRVFKEGKVRDTYRVVLSKDTKREYRYIAPVYCVDGRGFGCGGVTLYDSIKKMPYITKVKSNYSEHDVIEHKDIDKLLHWLVTIVG